MTYCVIRILGDYFFFLFFFLSWWYTYLCIHIYNSYHKTWKKKKKKKNSPKAKASLKWNFLMWLDVYSCTGVRFDWNLGLSPGRIPSQNQKERKKKWWWSWPLDRMSLYASWEVGRWDDESLRPRIVGHSSERAGLDRPSSSYLNWNGRKLGDDLDDWSHEVWTGCTYTVQDELVHGIWRSWSNRLRIGSFSFLLCFVVRDKNSPKGSAFHSIIMRCM